MPLRRIFALCPDYEPAAGGIRKLYRHVDAFNQQGFNAAILHQLSSSPKFWRSTGLK